MPEWGGYWYWDKVQKTIIIHTVESEELDIRSTKDVAFTFSFVLRDDWVII